MSAPFNPAWITAAIGIGTIVVILGVTVSTVRESKRTIKMLRNRSHIAEQMWQWLTGLVEQVWYRAMPDVKMPSKPDLRRLPSEEDSE